LSFLPFVVNKDFRKKQTAHGTVQANINFSYTTLQTSHFSTRCTLTTGNSND